MSDMVYQGIAFGPPLWNAFFADAKDAIEKAGFSEIVYADGLNAFCILERERNDIEAFARIRGCQRMLRKCGAANQVSFDMGKESTRIAAHQRSGGSSFHTPGVEFDRQLLVREVVRSCIVECGWRLRTS
eukprot:992341-Alexandrium_andersonii.AAC.1